MDADTRAGTEPHREQEPHGTVVRSSYAARLLTYLMVMGPGLIVMEADNDSGAVLTYAQAGGQYGLHLLWVLLILLPVTYFVQEMVVRLGIATGKGHAAMIYQRFGPWWGLFSLCDLHIVNFATLVTEFAAIDEVSAAFGISPVIGVPLVAAVLAAVVLTGSYRRWERIICTLCLLDTCWFVLAFLVKPPLGEVVANSFIPNTPEGGWTGDLIFLVIGVIGTTIAPWQLFFQQSCIADKRLRFADLFDARLDTFTAAVFTILVAGAMLICGAALLAHGGTWTDPAAMALFLGPIFGPVMKYGILLFWLNAAILGTTAVSLASAWAQGEIAGWRSSLNVSFRDAPGFYSIYILAVALAAGLVLLPGAPLNVIILGVQVLAGIMLPSAIVFLNLLLNDKQVLSGPHGSQFLNKPWNNVVNWVIITVLFVMSGLLAAQVLLPSYFPGGTG
jgi:Mn2+/Fe2+ NRAMP family transporter